MKYRVKLLGPVSTMSGNLCSRAFISKCLHFENGVSDEFVVDDSNEQISGRLAQLSDDLAAAYGAANFKVIEAEG